jgi:hypothetical protein
VSTWRCAGPRATPVAWRRARRTENFDPVTRADGNESSHVGRDLERRGQHPLACRLADFVQEALEKEGLEADQRSRLFEEHFSRHLSDADVKALTRSFEKVSAHARPLRPGRIRV